MKIRIISVGRKSSPAMTLLCGEYQKRLEPYHSVEWQLIAPITGKMDRNEQKQRESQAIIKLINKDDVTVLLDETGQLFSNQQVSKLLYSWQQTTSAVCFIIGGAYGVSADIKRRANVVWSLSSLVFPHELMRLMLVEQLYRAQTILQGLPYHHV